MRAVVQRVLDARVEVEGRSVGSLDGPGLLVYLGVTHADGPDEVTWMARKIWDLRLLREERSASDVGAPVLVVSQFTLYGDARKGRRPDVERRRAGSGLGAGVRRGLRRAAPPGRAGGARRLRRRHAGPLHERRPGHPGARALMPPPAVTGPTPSARDAAIRTDLVRMTVAVQHERPPSRMSAPPTHADYQLSQLDQLEAESIHIFREVAAEFEKPVLMFSGGKDSIVMMRLAEKAFYPAKIPFPLLQVDTGYDFPEVLQTRDNWVNRLGVKLIVASVEEALANGIVVDDGKTSRNRHQIGTLLNAIEEKGFTAAFGGGRRDEEKARAKERVYSHRDEFGQWDPKMQRPELWSLYNGRIHEGEHMRIFPISNWTELDIWHYIGREGSRSPSIYFSHQRRVFQRDGMLLSESEHNPTKGNETVEERTVRFRTVGDLTLTGCVESEADTIPKIIARSPSPASPSVARPAATTGSPRPPWRTGRRKATSDARHRLRAGPAHDGPAPVRDRRLRR